MKAERVKNLVGQLNENIGRSQDNLKDLLETNYDNEHFDSFGSTLERLNCFGPKYSGMVKELKDKYEKLLLQRIEENEELLKESS